MRPRRERCARAPSDARRAAPIGSSRPNRSSVRPPSPPSPISATRSLRSTEPTSAFTPDVDLAIHRRHPPGRGVPEWAGPARRRCCPHPLSRRWPGHRVGHPGRRQPRVEARPGRQGVSAPSLLDTYHAERHPAGARALRLSMAQTALQRADPRTIALSETIDDLMTTAPARRQIAGLIHGLDVAYDLGEGHPLLGRRMPDLDLDTPAGPTRVFALLHDAATGTPRLRRSRSRARRHLALGRPRARPRRAVHRRVGTAGARAGRAAGSRARSTRRSRRMGRLRKPANRSPTRSRAGSARPGGTGTSPDGSTTGRARLPPPIYTRMSRGTDFIP